MRRGIKVVGMFLGAVLLSSMAMAAQPAPTAKTASTLENLMAAYNGECNAQANYLEFAKKAKAEGYLRVAKLFDAVATSEGVHAAHHAKLIAAHKGTPKATLVKAKIGTTQENLQAALAGETADIEKMYPGFIQQAELEKETATGRSFGGSKAIEAIHVNWYKQALADLPKWKANGEFYTCKICGNVVDKMDFEYCPICKAPISEFVQAK